MVRSATNANNFEMDFKASSQLRKFEFNVFSILHLNIAITFDALDRFQENKVFKTAQIIRSSKNW